MVILRAAILIINGGVFLKFSKVYILAGGNLGDRKKILFEAEEQLRSAAEVVAVSSFYKSEAWGMDNSPEFINQAWCVHTGLQPWEFLALLQQIESQYPRERNPHQYLNRYLDLDILYWNQEVIDLPELKVPHPKVYERHFALLPLCEIAPQLRDPATGCAVKQHLQQCRDNGKVVKL
mgnify:CR=1 FL=1